MQRRSYLKIVGAGATAGLAGCTGGDGGDGGDGGSDGGSDGSGGGGGGDGGSTSGGEMDPIVIGALEPEGFAPFKPWVGVHTRGLKIGIEEINEQGDLERELELVTADSAADPAKADSEFRRLVEQEDAVAITGPVSSDVGIRTAQTAEELEVPNLLHMAGSEAILSRDSRYTFRVGWPTGTANARADVQYVEQNDISSVGAVIGDYAWGRAVESAFEEFMPSDVELHIEAAPLGTDDFKPFLRRIPDDVEEMNFVGHPSGAFTAVGQMFDLGMEPRITQGVDGPAYAMVNILGDTVTRGIISRHLADTERDAYKELGEKVAERFDVPMSQFEPIGYTTAIMVGRAAAEAGADPVGIADFIRNGSFDLMYSEPLEYTEWGEFKNLVLNYSEYVEGAPPYYADAGFDLEPVGQTDPIPPTEPQG